MTGPERRQGRRFGLLRPQPGGLLLSSALLLALLIFAVASPVISRGDFQELQDVSSGQRRRCKSMKVLSPGLPNIIIGWKTRRNPHVSTKCLTAEQYLPSRPLTSLKLAVSPNARFWLNLAPLQSQQRLSYLRADATHY